jgi:hypothetical protein
MAAIEMASVAAARNFTAFLPVTTSSGVIAYVALYPFELSTPLLSTVVVDDEARRALSPAAVAIMAVTAASRVAKTRTRG